MLLLASSVYFSTILHLTKFCMDENGLRDLAFWRRKSEIYVQIPMEINWICGLDSSSEHFFISFASASSPFLLRFDEHRYKLLKKFHGWPLWRPKWRQRGSMHMWCNWCVVCVCDVWWLNQRSQTTDFPLCIFSSYSLLYLAVFLQFSFLYFLQMLIFQFSNAVFFFFSFSSFLSSFVL